MYQQHLEGAATFDGMWQHALKSINEAINASMESRYKTINKKLNTLIEKQKMSKPYTTHQTTGPITHTHNQG